MDIIQHEIKCEFCKQSLQIPVVLLPCGQLMCQKHAVEKTDKIECVSCDGDHAIPSSGFPRVKAFEKILETRIEKCDFGCPEYAKTYKSCKTMEKMLDDLDKLRSDPLYHLDKVVSAYRADVDLKREQLKLKIDEEAEAIIRMINDYEERCKAHLKDEKLGGGELNEVTKKVIQWREQLEKWKEELKILENNEEKWNGTNKECVKIIEELGAKFESFKLCLTMKKKFELKVTQTKGFFVANFVDSLFQ